jgi:hypothetical protein
MLPLLLLTLYPPPANADGLDQVRKRFGEPHLPTACKAEVFGGQGVRLRLPAGQLSMPFENGRPDELPYVAIPVEGDFLATARVRLVCDREAGGAGVTAFHQKPDGTRQPVVVPEVAGGLAVIGPGRAHAHSHVHYRRRGDDRRAGVCFAAQQPDGSGVRCEPNGAHTETRYWVSLKRVGGIVELAGRPDADPPGPWGAAHQQNLELPKKVWLRLFATGNLDKPFSVEFDRLTVAPLPAAGK